MKYPANLLSLSKEKYHQVIVDKDRWWLAYRWYHGKTKWEVKNWLSGIANNEIKEDMMRRINIMAGGGYV